MNLKDFKWEDDNNVTIYFDNDYMSLTLDNIPHFVNFLKGNKGGFYLIMNNNNHPWVAINRDKIKYVNFKEDKK